MRFSSCWVLAGLLLATACGRGANQPAAAPDTSQLMQSGFEESLGWGGAEQPSLTTAKAHGGKVAAQVSPQVPFGYTFARTLGELGLPAGAQQLELTGWVLRPEAGSTASLVVQLDASRTDQSKVYYEAWPVTDAVPTTGEWKEMHLTIAVPTNALSTNSLKIYLWNDKASAPTYLDDVTLRRVVGK